MKTWREVFKVHPAAEMFPRMTADELRELVDDIKKNGLAVPVDYAIGDGEYVLLDGRNRWDALELLGHDVVNTDGKPFGCYAKNCGRVPDAAAFIISRNIHRRHLTAEQRRDIVGKLLKLDPTKSNRTIAKTTGVDDKTVGAVRSKLEATAEIPQLAKTTGADGKVRPAKKPITKTGKEVYTEPNRGKESGTALIATTGGVIPGPGDLPDPRTPRAKAREARERAERSQMADAVARFKELWGDVPVGVRFEARAAIIRHMDANLPEGMGVVYRSRPTYVVPKRKTH